MNKKGISSEMYLDWLIYAAITAVIVVAILVVPQSILNNSIQPTQLDIKIMQNRIENSLTKKYSPTEGQIPAINVKVSEQISKFRPPSEKQKKYGVKIEADGVHYINKEYYEKAKDLVGMGYKGQHYEFFYSGKEGNRLAKIDQVYPPRYEQ